MSPIEKYRERLNQVYISQNISDKSFRDSLLSSFENSVVEMGDELHNEEDIIEVFGTPFEYYSNYKVSHGVNKNEDLSNMNIFDNLKTRPPKVLINEKYQFFAILLFFVPFFIQYMTYLLSHLNIISFSNKSLFSYLNPFVYILSTKSIGDANFITYNWLAVSFGYFLLLIPYLLELFSGLTSIYLFDRRNSLRLRNLFRKLYFTYESFIFFTMIPQWSYGSNSAIIFTGPFYIFFELIILIKQKYLHPIEDNFPTKWYYAPYLGLLSLYWLLLNVIGIPINI